MTLLLGVSPEAFGSIFASVVAVATGIGAYHSNRRTKHNAEVADEANKTAELNRAEVEAWTKLIDTLTKQYEGAVAASSAAIAETAVLRGRLAEGNAKFEAIAEDLREAHERCAVLERRVETLRGEVTRLGGDVDEINRVGKRGQPGPKGDPGDKGPPGDGGG